MTPNLVFEKTKLLGLVVKAWPVVLVLESLPSATVETRVRPHLWDREGVTMLEVQFSSPFGAL